MTLIQANKEIKKDKAGHALNATPQSNYVHGANKVKYKTASAEASHCDYSKYKIENLSER
jgi:hypothetical protein